MNKQDERWNLFIEAYYIWDDTPGDEGWRPATNWIYKDCSTQYIDGPLDGSGPAVLQVWECNGLVKDEMLTSKQVRVLGPDDGYDAPWQVNAEE